MSTPDPFGAALDQRASSDNSDLFGSALSSRAAANDEPKKNVYDPARPTVGAPIGNMALDMAGGIARGIGTVGDVVRNDVRAFSGKPTVEYGSPESYAASLAKPFEHEPDAPETPDVKEQIRRGLPKLGDQPAVKAALATPAGQTLTSDVLAPAMSIGGTALALSPMTKGIAGRMAPLEVGSAEDIINRSTAGQSMGAAGAAPNISAASPELRQAISQAAQKTGGAVNPDVLQAHIEADKHGVQLMKGQATREPGQFTAEQNSTHPDVVARLNAQNGQMVDAIDNIRREASPTAVGNDAIENGQTVVDALKAHDEPIQADIRAKYKALTDANGGNIPIDSGSFVANVDAALKKNYLTKSVPAGASELLEGMRAGEPLDFEGFEAARTRLAEAQRAGGSEAAAAKIIRGQLEQMPLSAQAANLKGLADTARAAAKARFDALDADPAYQAAVTDVSNGVKKGEPSPLADRFLDKYALGTAPKANVDTMMGKLDDDAKGAVASHALNAVRKAAINPNGNVLPNGYNGAMQKLGPKIDSLVAPEIKDDLESLGRTITRAKVEPAGGKVNYSRSGVVARDAIQGAAESFANVKTGGAYGVIKKMLPKDNGFAKEALKHGAGLDQLQAKP